MKQETLEEAAGTHAFNFYEKEDRPLSEHSFKAGAKWQQEQMEQLKDFETWKEWKNRQQ